MPQLFARYADGTGMLADCPSHAEAGGERAIKAAAAVAEACWQVGFVYRRLERLDDVVEANMKWLAGYRHLRNQGRPGLAAAVQEAFAQPRPLMEGVEAAGDPVEVLPAVFHALWAGQLTAPLDVPLHEHVLVHAAGSEAESAAGRKEGAGRSGAEDGGAGEGAKEAQAPEAGGDGVNPAGGAGRGSTSSGRGGRQGEQRAAGRVAGGGGRGARPFSWGAVAGRRAGRAALPSGRRGRGG
ncbi:TnsA-like heteromeric transposase endonuclease subunit [Streptomyces klenkii]